MPEQAEHRPGATLSEACRLDCPLSGWTFRALWPVEDMNLGSRTAIAMAAADLPEVAERAGIRLLADPQWSVEEVGDPSQWPYTDCAVVACAPAVPARPTREQWPAIIAHFAAHQWPDRRVATLLELPAASVAQLRRQHTDTAHSPSPTRVAA